MKVDWKGLVRGLYNKAMGAEWVKEVAAKRYNDHCKSCDHNSKVAIANGKYKSIRPDEHCVLCGCNIDLKTHDMAQICPKKLWVAEVSIEDGEAIDKIVNQNEKSEEGLL